MGSRPPSSSGTITRGRGGSHSHQGRGSQATCTDGSIVGKAARYSTAQGSATAALRRSTAAAFRNTRLAEEAAASVQGSSGGRVRVWYDDLAIAGDAVAGVAVAADGHRRGEKAMCVRVSVMVVEGVNAPLSVNVKHTRKVQQHKRKPPTNGGIRRSRHRHGSGARDTGHRHVCATAWEVSFLECSIVGSDPLLCARVNSD